ncbi:MAG: glycosyltransferase family 4 protein [Patescibacteria group bacterium]|nr:glycosyltransferase family 4 protein [Patescibacteria group bacterium]
MDTKKNILIVTNSGNRGGMEVHVLNIIEGLYEKFNFFVVCPKGNIVSEYEKYAKVIILRPKFDIDPVYILKLIRLFKILNISVVHTHELKAGVNGLIAGSFARIPLKISHQHTPVSNWQISPTKKKINRFVYKIFVNNLSSFEVALTPEIKKQKIGEGIRKEKIIIIPNGISLKAFNLPSKLKIKHRIEICEKYGISPQNLIVGNISRLTIEKGHSIFIKVLRELENEKKISNVKFLFAGEGELREELIRMVKSYGLPEKTIFTGFISEEDKIKVLSSLDVFVFPTLAEGFGIVLIEAMASGLPCIVSNLPVLQDVAGLAVLYFENGKEDSLKENLAKMISSKKMREEFASKSLAQVKKYDIKKFWESYNGLYENTLPVSF